MFDVLCVTNKAICDKNAAGMSGSGSLQPDSAVPVNQLAQTGSRGLAAGKLADSEAAETAIGNEDEQFNSCNLTPGSPANSECFLARIRKIAKAHPAGIILREKDLPKESYAELAKAVMNICREENVPCILHSYTEVAPELNADAIHLPLRILRSLSDEEKSRFRVIGASCHSTDEALEAEKLGATYITAGHIFDTDCKKGLPGRGLEFLQSVCSAVTVPVFAIGGITPETAPEVREAGACGVCLMSSLMTAENPADLIEKIQEI